jgi:predicted RNA-binding protein with PIN domain
MSNRWVLVDGYNVLHSWPQFTSRRSRLRTLEQRREALLRVLRQYADHSGQPVTVVFDGYAAKRKPLQGETATGMHAGRGLEVLFSDKGKTADEVIERVVALVPHQERILVVTSDNVERQAVETLGAQSLSAELFAAEVADALRELASEVRHHGRQPRHGMSGLREHF